MSAACDKCGLPVQVAEGLQLSGEQRGSMTGLWRGFNERMQRILAARHSIHATITSSMPDGIMGRDFARNFLKVPRCFLACCPSLEHPHLSAQRSLFSCPFFVI